MLVQTIPSYRLPRPEIEREITMIERMGVDIECNSALGRDFTLQGLRDEGYEAVFLGVGAPKGSGLRIKNEEADGVTDAIEFLRAYNLQGTAKVGKRVVVIGGGNAAIDAARTAVRLGAETVTVLYRRTRAEMPAWAEEIEEAEKEGVFLKTLIAPQEVVLEKGKVAGVSCNHMSLGEFDSSGRRRPEVCGDATFVEPADQVIAAIGQKLETKPLLDGLQVKLNAKNYIWADAVTAQTSLEWLFAGGDASDGPSSVVQAIGAGERAAVGIDQYLTGEEHAFWRELYQVDTAFDPDADPSEAPRAAMNLIPVDARAMNFDEVEVAFVEETAVREARRCLRCDYREEMVPSAR